MISFDDITLRFGGTDLFKNIGFMLREGDRVGLVGRNGAGKSTIMKIITGEMSPSEGKVNKQADLSIGYLPQHLHYSDTTTVFDEVKKAFEHVIILENELHQLEKEITIRKDWESDSYLELCNKVNDLSTQISHMGASQMDEHIERTLLGLGFLRSDFTRSTSEFSGGWRMRIELAKILLKKPQVLLLDEPTNHLDLPAIQWLEEVLQSFTGALLLVSHDRVFLDTVTNRTIEISLGRIFDYRVPYTQFVELSEERKKQNLASYENQQKVIKDTEDFIERFRYKATKSVQVQARIKQLDKLERIEVEETDNSAMKFKFPPAPRSGSVVLDFKKVTKKYESKTVFSDLEFNIQRGEKVAFVGKNGEGKTTLSRIIVDDLDFDGELIKGHNTLIGYFAQNQHLMLDESKTVFQTLDDVAVGDIRTKLRDILGAFLFRGEDIDKKVVALSGGERSRLALAKLILQPINLLVMDEPTNHLDMLSKSILKNALVHYDGTLIVVSHDRDFLDGLTHRVIEFANGKIKDYPGSVFEFLESKKLLTLKQLEQSKRINASQTKETTQTKESYLERKEIERAKRKVENKIEKIEKQIAETDEQIQFTEKELSNPAIYSQALHDELLKKYGQLKKQSDSLYADWENAQKELEGF